MSPPKMFSRNFPQFLKQLSLSSKHTTSFLLLKAIYTTLPASDRCLIDVETTSCIYWVRNHWRLFMITNERRKRITALLFYRQNWNYQTFAMRTKVTLYHGKINELMHLTVYWCMGTIKLSFKSLSVNLYHDMELKPVLKYQNRMLLSPTTDHNKY